MASRLNFPLVVVAALVACLAPAGAAHAAIVADPTAVDFGDVQAGYGVLDGIAIEAVGETEVIASADLSDPSGPFSIDVEECVGMTLAPGEECFIGLVFDAPDTTADFAAHLMVVSDDADTAAVALQGSSHLAGALVPGVSHVGFGRRPVQTVPFSNAGDGPLVIQGSGATAGFEIVRDSCTGTLAPRAVCDIEVRFTSTQRGLTRGSLAVTGHTSGQWIPAASASSMTPATFTVTVPLTGRFLPPHPAPSPPPDYGSLEADLAQLADAVRKLVRGGSRRRLRLPVLRAPAAGRLSLRLYTRFGGRRVSLGRAFANVEAGQVHALGFSLTKRGRVLLRRGVPTRVRAIVSFDPTGSEPAFRQAPELLVRPPKRKRRAGR
jgi:hypothetical protein